MSKSTATPVVTVDSLVAELTATPGAKRVTVRNNWTKAMMDAVLVGNHDLAGIYAEAMKAAPSGPAKSTAVEVDWRQITANRVDSLRRAADLIESGELRPNGTPDSVDLTDLPEAEASSLAEAEKLASVRLAGTRNVPEFISDRVAELGDGFHTASDLARGQIDAPSTGAIGAVWEKMTSANFEVEGVTAGFNEKGSKAFGA